MAHKMTRRMAQRRRRRMLTCCLMLRGLSQKQSVTWDRALSLKLGLCTNHTPRHSEPGAQTLLVPTHLPNWAFSFQPPSLPLFFTPFHTCLLLPFCPHRHPSLSTSKNVPCLATHTTPPPPLPPLPLSPP